jgi:RNA polymerase sigma-70 factor (ECF subfamily)
VDRWARNGPPTEAHRSPSPNPHDDGPHAEGIDDRGLHDPISFEELFEAEHRRLFGALYLITRDRHEAEDIGQEAFVRVFERWDRVGSMVDPVGYLYRVAMNVFRSRYRRAVVAARRMFADVFRDEISEIDERDSVVRMLAGLNAQQRAALILTSLLGYSSDEAGALLGISGSTVRVLTSRARTTLRKQTEMT